VVVGDKLAQDEQDFQDLEDSSSILKTLFILSAKEERK